MRVYGRFIVDFRVSEPSHRTLARDIRRGLGNGGRVDGDDGERIGWVVGPAGRDQADALSAGLTQSELRRTLPDSLYDAEDEGLDRTAREQRRVLMLPPLTIPPGGQFRLIICCRDDDPRQEPNREYGVDGAVDNVLPLDRRIVERGRNAR